MVRTHRRGEAAAGRTRSPEAPPRPSPGVPGRRAVPTAGLPLPSCGEAGVTLMPLRAHHPRSPCPSHGCPRRGISHSHP